jgi:hypothetical protein
MSGDFGLRIPDFGLKVLSAALLLLAPRANAETLKLGDFEVPVQPVLQVSYKGKLLMHHDSWDIAPLVDGGVTVSHDGRGFSYTQRTDGNTLRREVYLTDDGLEITGHIHVENLFGRQPDNLYAYHMCMPPDLFDGQKPFAVYGRQDKYSGREFDLSKPLGPGESYSGRFRHLAFKIGADTINLDMSPMGPPVGYTVNHDLSYGARPTRDGEFFALKFYRFVSHFGGDLTFKTVIRVGQDDYYRHHHLQVGHYTVPFGHERSIDFTAGAEVEGFTPCDGSASDAQRGYGWRSGVVRMLSFPSGGPLKSDAAAGSSRAEFEVSLKPGYYLANHTLYNPNRAVGPFSLSIDGKPVLENAFANKGQLRYLSASFYADSPITTVTFDGDWQVNAIEFTPVFHKIEDYLIKRPFWNIPE